MQPDFTGLVASLYRQNMDFDLETLCLNLLIPLRLIFNVIIDILQSTQHLFIPMISIPEPTEARNTLGWEVLVQNQNRFVP